MTRRSEWYEKEDERNYSVKFHNDFGYWKC